MSYVRPAKIQEVADWLLSNPIVVHFTPQEAQKLAEALIEKWDLVGIFSNPT